VDTLVGGVGGKILVNYRKQHRRGGVTVGALDDQGGEGLTKGSKGGRSDVVTDTERKTFQCSIIQG
jgi:hypothetical protein